MKKLLSIVLVVIMALSVIPFGSMVDVSAATTSQQNIVGWADYYYGITWTAKKTIAGWHSSSASYTLTKGNTYHIPYAQPISRGAYVGYGVSVDTFISAVKDVNSKFYTSTSVNGSCYSTYYGMDCSSFVSACWGISRSTTSSIPSKGTSLGKLSSSTVNKIQIGDCLNSTSDGHVVLVTDVTYSGSTVKSVEITEQTPPQLKRTTYTASNLVSKYSSKGYSIYRYNGTVPAPPSEKPVITSANGDNHTEVTIKWTEVSGATKYKVERRKAGDDNYSTAKDSTTSLSFTDTGLSKNQRYYYKVTAYNGSTKLGTSEAAGVYTKFDPPTITAVSDSKLKVTWDSVAKAESYTIMRKKSDGDYSEIKTVTGTSYTDSGLSASTEYRYWIRANCNVDGTDLVAKSTSSSKYTLTKAPVIKEIDDISTSEVKVIWNAVSGASSYRIDRRKAGDSNYTTVKSGVTDTFFNDTGLETGQRYYYIVYAKNSAGESAASTAMGGHTKFNAPNTSATDKNIIKVNWNGISDAQTYTIRRRVFDGEYKIIDIINGTSYDDIGLQPGTQYFYWIQADCNVDGADLVAKTVSKGQYTLMDRPKVLAPSSTSVTLEWDGVRGDSTYKYEVLRSAVGENNFKVVATTTSTIYTDNSLSPSKEYVYRIKAFNSNSNYCTETFEPVWVGTSACSHSYTSTTISPTCTEVGTITYTCTICGGTYSETIPEKGHLESVVPGYDSTCKDIGLTESVQCSVCNKTLKEAVVIGAKGHLAEENWVTVSSADGKTVQVKYCSRCNDIAESREIIEESKATDPTENVTENTKSTETTEAPETTMTVTTDPVENPSESVGTDPTETVIVDLTDPTETVGIDPTEITEVTESVTGDIAESSTTEQESTSIKVNETKPGESESDKCLLGDVNRDGKVNIKDATTIQKFLANIIKLDEIQVFVADTDQNGKVNIKDATVLQKFLAGFDLKFPINTYIDAENENAETVSSTCNVEETDCVQDPTTSIGSNDEPTTTAISEEVASKDEVATTPNDNSSSNDEEPSIPDDLVKEADSYYYSKGTYSYEYHIPEINLNDSKIEQINEEIWDWCYESSMKGQLENWASGGSTYFYNMDYDWAVNGDVLSLCVSKLFQGNSKSYKIYNVSMTTYDLLDTEEVLEKAGYTYEEYQARLKEVMASGYLEYNRVDENTDLDNYISIYGDKIIKTLSEENLAKTRIFLNDNGELCVVGIRYSAAGAELYYVLYNLDTHEVNQRNLDIVNNMILK